MVQGRRECQDDSISAPTRFAKSTGSHQAGMRNEMMLDLEQRLEDGKEPAVKTIDRAARVLRVLAAGGQDGLALRDVAMRCEFGKPTAHRLLAALIDAGFAFQDTETRRYRLGV